MRKALIDSGPLIALFDKSDNYHYAAIKFLKDYDGLLLTTWSVISEVFYING